MTPFHENFSHDPGYIKMCAHEGFDINNKFTLKQFLAHM